MLDGLVTKIDSGSSSAEVKGQTIVPSQGNKTLCSFQQQVVSNPPIVAVTKSSIGQKLKFKSICTGPMDLTVLPTGNDTCVDSITLPCQPTPRHTSLTSPLSLKSPALSPKSIKSPALSPKCPKSSVSLSKSPKCLSDMLSTDGQKDSAAAVPLDLSGRSSPAKSFSDAGCGESVPGSSVASEHCAPDQFSVPRAKKRRSE